MADITYCGHYECTAKECMRHYNNAPHGRIVSWAMFDCPYMPLDDFDGYVEVVRCKNCEHGVIDSGTNRLMCARRGEIRPNGHVWGGTATLPENYCNYGKRRTDGTPPL